MKTTFQKSSFEFLKELKKHNDRDWFNANKERYLKEHEQVIRFADTLLSEMNKHDVIETPNGKKSLHRIYRDIRFSKDKTPYNTHWGGSFSRATKLRRGSYYFHLSPGNSFAAGGFWGPNPEDLKRIRDEFSYDYKTIKKILESKKIKDTFGKLEGEKIKTTPKGFNPDDEAIDLLRYKQFLLIKKFTDKEVLSDGFAKQLSDAFKQMRPFLDYMSEALTTDVNGEVIV
jgi:uncharacterized protein (TIGR02453 family)